MSRSVVIVGCGGFGRELRDLIADCVDAGQDWEFLGYLDDHPSAPNAEAVTKTGDVVLGGLEWLDDGPVDTHVFIGIGDGDIKARVRGRVLARGMRESVIIHPSATLGQGVTIGAGSVICAGVRIMTNVSIGYHVHVNLNCTIGHDSQIADYVTINPLAAISGNVSIGPKSLIGTHAAILQNLDVGCCSTVGGAALVVQDVFDNVTVKGVPAK